MTREIGYLWSLRWQNPYHDPPGGQPRTKAEYFFPTGAADSRRAPAELVALHVPGDVYGIFGQCIIELPKAEPAERTVARRKKILQRRAEDKYPLFAEQYVSEELERKADYYAGHDERRDADRAEMIAYWTDRIAFLIANGNRLITYGRNQ